MAAEQSGEASLPDTQGRLLELLADGAWHSGERLAASLGVSRTAVWKGIRVLSGRGLKVERIRGHGYRLTLPLDPLDRAHLNRVFHTLAGTTARLEVHEIVDSTNDVARERPDDSPLLVVAEYQREGKGRRGRRWWSPYGAGLCFSLALSLEPTPEGLGPLPLACALGVVDGLEKLGAVPVGIKWPNDIDWRGQKLGGILVEVQGESAGPFWTVVGVGLNVHRPQGAWPADVAARLATLDDLRSGGVWRRDDVLSSVVTALWERLIIFAREGFGSMTNDYERHDVLFGRAVLVHQGDGHPLQGIARGIDAAGWLRLETATGEIRLGVGEVSVRPA